MVAVQSRSGASVSVHIKCQKGEKCDLGDFDHGLIVCSRQAGLSIFETTDLLGFSHTAVSRVFSECGSIFLDDNSSNKFKNDRIVLSRKASQNVQHDHIRLLSAKKSEAAVDTGQPTKS